jgi:hypothetical protein
MDFNSLKEQVSNLTLYDLKAGVRKVQNGVFFLHQPLHCDNFLFVILYFSDCIFFIRAEVEKITTKNEDGGG